MVPYQVGPFGQDCNVVESLVCDMCASTVDAFSVFFSLVVIIG